MVRSLQVPSLNKEGWPKAGVVNSRDAATKFPRNCSLSLNSGKMLRDANHYSSFHFEHLHDLCVVRTFEVPQLPIMEGDFCELAYRVRGILLSGSGKPPRVLSILDRAVENDSGSHHSGGVCYFFDHVSRRVTEVESRGRIPVHCLRGFLHVLSEGLG